MTDEYEKLRIIQPRGPTIQAQAKLLAKVEFEKRGQVPVDVTLEVYETVGGALIAVRRSMPIEFDGVEEVRALVVEPQDDAQAMHFEVMEHFDYEDRARTMARKLKWKLTRIVA
jgi:hypothetical protein